MGVGAQDKWLVGPCLVQGAALRARPAGHSAGVTDPSRVGGRVPGGSPFPGSIIHWPCPKRAWGEGHVRLGVPRGVLLQDPEPDL